MRIRVFGSSSKGNGYAITDSDNKTLLIECGVPVIEVKKYLDFKLDDIVGCIVSHSHGDHIKYVDQYLKSGINVAMSMETAKAKRLDGHHRVSIIESGMLYSTLFDGFTVLPVEMKHDVHCLAFVIKHREMGNLLFMTDSYYSPYRFANINHWLIECNYTEAVMNRNLGSDVLNQFLRDRILESHLSLENLVQMLEKNDLSGTKNIIVTHLSDTNSSETEIVKTLQRKTGKQIFVADPGKTINLSKTPF